MRNRYLGRTSAHRRALFSNLIKSLFMHESIETTLAKAKDLRIIAEKIISIAKRNKINTSSLIRKYLHHDEAKKKLITELTQRYMQRPGGYTRIMKTRFRSGDAAPMAIIMLVNDKTDDVPVNPVIDSSITQIKSIDAKAHKSTNHAKTTEAKSSRIDDKDSAIDNITPEDKNIKA